MAIAANRPPVLLALALLLTCAARPLTGQAPAGLAVPADTWKGEIDVAPGEALHVESTGSGDAVVIVPGFFDAAFGYRKVIGPIAAAGHRVVVVEPLGVGASGRPREADYSLEAQARRIGVALDSLHISGATFLARSVGASAVFRLELARPALVSGIVSIEGGVAESAGTPGLRHGLSLASLLGHFGLQGMVKGKLRDRFRDSSGDPSWITDASMAGYLAPLQDHYQDVLAAYKAMASAPEQRPLAPRLGAIRCPVVLMIGGAPHDGGVGDDELARMRAGIHSLRVITVPGAGAWIEEERPAAVIDAVTRMAAR
jgi:pimeloyl-ACP methyl ester carboxylesterase